MWRGAWEPLQVCSVKLTFHFALEEQPLGRAYPDPNHPLPPSPSQGFRPSPNPGGGQFCLSLGPQLAWPATALSPVRAARM